jgi:DNA-binding CsgD family transcriptional regulator
MRCLPAPLTDLLATLQEMEYFGVGFVSLTEALDLTTPGRSSDGWTMREVLQGRSYLSTLIAKDLFSLLLDAQAKSAPNMTPRQREILQRVAEGKTAKEVAACLNISVRPVEGHKYEIMEALGAKTSAEYASSAAG